MRKMNFRKNNNFPSLCSILFCIHFHLHMIRATHAYDINSFLKPRRGEKFNRIVIKFLHILPFFLKYSPSGGNDVIWEEGLQRK